MATSLSGTHVTTDDEDEEHQLPTNRHSGTEDPNRRKSNSSSITNFTINKTTSDFFLNSKQSSRTSSLNPLPLASPSLGISLKKPSVASPIRSNVAETKEKKGVRKFIQKIFKTSNTPRNPSNIRSPVLNSPKSPELNIDNVRGTAYPPMSPLPITQGPIRLLVLRHGERLDRYYSSQWLRQAFDKDGNFCRFSPILP